MTDIPNVSLDNRSDTVLASPAKIVKVRELFGVDTDMEVPAFSEADERVPDLDPTYVFDPDTTMAICAGFILIPIIIILVVGMLCVSTGS